MIFTALLQPAQGLLRGRGSAPVPRGARRWHTYRARGTAGDVARETRGDNRHVLKHPLRCLVRGFIPNLGGGVVTMQPMSFGRWMFLDEGQPKHQTLGVVQDECCPVRWPSIRWVGWWPEVHGGSAGCCCPRCSHRAGGSQPCQRPELCASRCRGEEPGGQAGVGSPAGCYLNSWRVLFLHIQTEVETRAQPDLVM